MSVLAYGDYQPTVVYVSLVCPVCDADLDPEGPYEIPPPDDPPAFVEERTKALLRGLIELCGTELERHETLWHLRRQRLRGFR